MTVFLTIATVWQVLLAILAAQVTIKDWRYHDTAFRFVGSLLTVMSVATAIICGVAA